LIVMDNDTIQLVADLTTQLSRHDGCSRMGVADYTLLDRALKWGAKQKEAPLRPWEESPAYCEAVKRLMDGGEKLTVQDACLLIACEYLAPKPDPDVIEDAQRHLLRLLLVGIIRVFVEDGLINEVDGIPAGMVVRVIDMDTEGSDESDGAYELSMDDRPAADDDERGHGPKPVTAFVTDHLPDGSTERPYEK
jgi:hypothetical protein